MAEYTATSGSYTTTLTVTEGTYNVANNTSPVTFTLTLKKNSGTGLWNNDSCPWSININGTSYSGTFTYDFRDYSSLTLKSSTTQTITHDGDGSKKIAVSASVNMDNTPYVYTMSPSGTLTLTTIPRASDVSVSNYSIANTTGSISATITSKANFYHKWRWKLGSGSWSSWANKGLISTTSSTVTVANTTLLAQLPTATSGSFNIEVATYSDSGYSNHVGTKSATCTVSVNTSNIKPSVSLGNIGLNSSPISGYAVAGYSKVQSAWTTTNSSGATSVTTYFTVSTGSLATTSSSSTSGTVVSNTIPSNASNYTLYIYAYAKDSRGAVSSTVNKSITVYGYQPPTANLSAYRTSSSSSTSEDGAGTYAYVTFSGAVRSSVNSQNTIQSTVCTYSGSISGTATNGGHYALADTQTVTFTLTVTDKVTSSTASVTIATASYPLDLYDDGNGHIGAGIGVVAESDTFKTGNIINDFTLSRTRLGKHTSYDYSNSSSGTGFMVIATITIIGAYANKGLYFEVSRRQLARPINACILFSNTANNDPTLVAFYADYQPTDLYLYKTGTSVWQLICYKTNYDAVSLIDVKMDNYLNSVISIDPTQSVLSAVPSGATQATQWSFPLATTATSATSATSATNATTSDYVRVKPLPNGADLNDNTYLIGSWGSASGTATSSLVNKPSDATTTVWLNTLVHGNSDSKSPTGTYYYATQMLFDYNGRMFTRAIQGTGTAGSHNFGGWRHVETIGTRIFNSALTGGNTATIQYATNYTLLRIFAIVAGDTLTTWEIDRNNIATTALKFSHSVPIYASDPGDWYLTIIDLTCTLSGTSVILKPNFYNKRIGTSGQITMNNNNNYRIYRVDGIL